MVMDFLIVACRAPTREELQEELLKVTAERERRIEFLGKDGVFVDEVLYMRDFHSEQTGT